MSYIAKLKKKGKKIPPPLQPIVMSRNSQSLSYQQKDILRYMNRTDVNKLFKTLESLPKIIRMNLEILNDDSLYNELNHISKRVYNNVYTKKKKKYNLKRMIIKIKNIEYDNSEITTFKSPIYFFKSTGGSRGVDTKDIWFPTNKNPIDLYSNRITKLEDPILESGIIPNNKKINIDKYGRFITLENAVISKYLSSIFK